MRRCHSAGIPGVIAAQGTAVTEEHLSQLRRFTQRLMDWVCEEGFCDEATRDKDWTFYAMMLLDGREPVAEYERVKQAVQDIYDELNAGGAAPQHGAEGIEGADESVQQASAMAISPG